MKKMNNYEFITNFNYGLTEDIFLKVMRTNNASDLFEYDKEGDCCYCKEKGNEGEPEYRGIFILENGYVDIEMNFFAAYDLTPVIDFFCCKKFGETEYDWCSDNFYGDVTGDFSVETDFDRDDWKEQLEKEMFNKLDKYCKAKRYDYTKPIK